MRVHLAVRAGLGRVPLLGLGPLRPGALRPVLLARLGADETRGLLLRGLHVLPQPRPALRHHRGLLLRHRLQALLHLQEVKQQQQPPAQRRPAPSQAVGGGSLVFSPAERRVPLCRLTPPPPCSFSPADRRAHKLRLRGLLVAVRRREPVVHFPRQRQHPARSQSPAVHVRKELHRVQSADLLHLQPELQEGGEAAVAAPGLHPVQRLQQRQRRRRQQHR